MVSGRHHSKAVKIAATVLARLAGEQAASDTFGVDRRTIRGWVKRDDVPTDSWAALDELAGAQLLEKVARGQVTNPATLATVRGIASRNRRYSELISRREARRAADELPEQPPERTPMQQQIDRLDDKRRMLWTCEIDAEMEDRAYQGENPPPPTGTLNDVEGLAWLSAEVDRLLALSDDEVEEHKQAYFELMHGSPTNRQSAQEPVGPTAPFDEPTPLPTARVAPHETRPMAMGSGRGRGEDGPWFDYFTGDRRSRFQP